MTDSKTLSKREQLVELAAQALHADYPDHLQRWLATPAGEELTAAHFRDEARAVLDAILPVVSTLESLEALPQGTGVVAARRIWEVRQSDGITGRTWLRGTDGGHWHYGIEEALPLAVVYQPEGTVDA